MKIQVVPMERRHTPALAALERKCFSEPWSQASLEEELTNPAAVFLVALGEGGEVLGYAGMHDIVGEGYVSNIAVFPEFRRMGAGKALVEALLRYGMEHRLDLITLEVRCSNQPAIRLYEQYGFCVEGIRKRFYRSPDEDGYIMTHRFSLFSSLQ